MNFRKDIILKIAANKSFECMTTIYVKFGTNLTLESREFLTGSRLV